MAILRQNRKRRWPKQHLNPKYPFVVLEGSHQIGPPPFDALIVREQHRERSGNKNGGTYKHFQLFVLYLDGKPVCRSELRKNTTLQEFLRMTRRYYPYSAYTLEKGESFQLYEYHALR